MNVAMVKKRSMFGGFELWSVWGLKLGEGSPSLAESNLTVPHHHSNG
jgi:hypothetical protein